VIAVLSDLDETQLPWLRDELAHVSDTTRGVIVEALGRMRHAGASHELAYLLDDPTSAVRLAAARALGRLDLRDARAQLAALARTDENPAVRRAAQDALARG
jgi:HEAT repeat protein